MMNLLFLHNNFPAQYRHVAEALGADSANKLVFITKREDRQMRGVTKIVYRPSRVPNSKTHHYIRPLEDAVLHGQAVTRAALALKDAGFLPDLIIGHVGWGPGLFMKDVFPDVPYLGHFEWYYHAHNSGEDFLEGHSRTLDERLRMRMMNGSILSELVSCDWGYVPTDFQRRQFPPEFQSKLSLLHEGVDTDYFLPNPDARLPESLNLPDDAEIVTYGTRGMEPYRGFPQFMRALPHIFRMRPKAHAVIMGEDRVAYGARLPEGDGWKKRLLAELDGQLDMNRVHFSGPLIYRDYLSVLQASHLHVYLTVPFVLSWSLIEALSTGCLILASDTAPVREAIEDGIQGWLRDFLDHEGLAQAMAEMLARRHDLTPLRQAARARAIEQYALRDQLPRFTRLIEDMAARRLPPRDG